MKREQIQQIFEQFENACYDYKGIECWPVTATKQASGRSGRKPERKKGGGGGSAQAWHIESTKTLFSAKRCIINGKLPGSQKVIKQILFIILSA